MTSRRFTLFLAFVLCGVPGRTCDANAHPDLSKTAGYRHESIPVAVEKLRGYRAVIFVNTTGDILDPEQRQALEGTTGHGTANWSAPGSPPSTHHAGVFAVDGTGGGAANGVSPTRSTTTGAIRVDGSR